MDVDSLFGGQTKAGEMDLQFIMQTTVLSIVSRDTEHYARTRVLLYLVCDCTKKINFFFILMHGQHFPDML